MKIYKTKNSFFEKFKKIDKATATQVKKKEENTNYRYEK